MICSKLCRSLRTLQSQLENVYGLEAGPHVCDFVALSDEQKHEAVLVKQSGTSDLELLIVFPQNINPEPPSDSDDQLQLIEGVSHFVHLSERARTELPTTHLELELQAEVDKFRLLAQGKPKSYLRPLHRWLFEQVAFFDPEDTPSGRRYRLANDLAARLWSRLVKRNDEYFTSDLLRRFYRLGQAEKLSLIAAI